VMYHAYYGKTHSERNLNGSVEWIKEVDARNLLNGVSCIRLLAPL